MTARVVAYLRDSGGREQDLSISQQEQAAAKWCQEHEMILTRVFVDAARSGAKTAGRDEFLAMARYLAAGAPETGIVIWEYARLSRDFDDLMYYVADLRRQGYAVYSIVDKIPEGLEGRLMEAILAWKNAKYLEDLRAATRRGRRYLIDVHNALPGGTAPIGYRFVSVEVGRRRDGSPHLAPRLEPDPATAPLVAEAFRMRANGATYKEINAALHIYPHIANYKYMLRNEIYTGVLHFDGARIPDFCPALIDRRTWEAAQRVNQARRERRANNHPRAVRSPFILSGLLRCARCGSLMHGSQDKKPDGREYAYYICNRPGSGLDRCGARYIPKAEIEGRVLDVLRQVIDNPVVIQDIYQAAREQIERDQTAQAAIVNKALNDLAVLDEQIKRIVAAIGDAGHSPALLAQLASLEKQQAEWRASLARLQSSPSAYPIPKLDELLQAARAVFATANTADQAVIVRGFVQEVRAEKSDRLHGEIDVQLPGIAGAVSLSLLQ